MNRIISFFKGKGFYLALALCILAAAASSFWAIRNVMRGVDQLDAQKQREESAWQQPDAAVNNPASDVPQTTPQPSAVPPSSSSQQQASSPSAAGQSDSGTSAASSALPAASYGLPVNGEVLLAFSGDDLIYNETLGDWRTHNGTDYACASGNSIQAAAAGQVTAVYSDALWGGVVEVTDADGRIWKYCGVDSAAVQQGAAVATGDLLGKAGAIPTEAGTLHLHLECLDGETWLDPAEIIAG